LHPVRPRSWAAAGTPASAGISFAAVQWNLRSQQEVLDTAPELTVEQVMDPGPTTIRPHISLAEITEYLQQRNSDRILVTTAEGRLMGVLYREDAERLLSEATADKE
jgi:CBS domain-containing protein